MCGCDVALASSATDHICGTSRNTSAKAPPCSYRSRPANSTRSAADKLELTQAWGFKSQASMKASGSSREMGKDWHWPSHLTSPAKTVLNNACTSATSRTKRCPADKANSRQNMEDIRRSDTRATFAKFSTRWSERIFASCTPASSTCDKPPTSTRVGMGAGASRPTLHPVKGALYVSTAEAYSAVRCEKSHNFRSFNGAVKRHALFFLDHVIISLGRSEWT